MKTGRDPLEIVLHIGVHRTGTTALQRSLGRQAKRLAAAGVVFWGPKVLREAKIAGILAAGEQAVQAGQGDPGSRASDGFLTALPQAGRLILSDENMAGTMHRNWTQGTLYPEVSPQLRAVLSLLPARPVAIYLTVRDFAGYWQSAFSHLHRVRGVSLFDATRLSASPGNSWLPALRAVRAACPEAPLHVARYDRTAAHRVMAALVGAETARTLSPPLQGVNASRPAGGDGIGALFSPDETERLDRAFEADWAEILRGVVPGVVVVADEAPKAELPSARPRRGAGRRRSGRADATRRGTERTMQ
ncbi:MAG TPA: hypothetical protein PLI43_02815 [Albidovulum sp.]|uniref:hypothetical protein n=1 Tax=Albidovulum sp. TaxID=1872424 RepID=UPI002B9744EC|nr:hypothetical protein [Albidovulum sp.]